MTKRILDIVDMQNDFMDPNGALYVKDADKIIAPTNRFLAAIKPGDFDFIFLKYDTHFAEGYKANPESQQFPDHCIFNSRGWQLAIDFPRELAEKIPSYQMNKNVFDMWAARPDLGKILFSDTFNEAAFNKLFTVTRLGTKKKHVARDRFLKDINADTEIVMIGVASDYCVHDAMLGYLKRGAKVTVLKNLVKGIGTPVPGRAASGRIEDVVRLDIFKSYFDTGVLRVIDTETFKQEVRNERKSKNRSRPIKPHRR